VVVACPDVGDGAGDAAWGVAGLPAVVKVLCGCGAGEVTGTGAGTGGGGGGGTNGGATSCGMVT
jgi:hypothetical protein